MPLTTAYLALGSNQGARLRQLQEAIRLLEARGAVLVVQGSRVYENRAVGMGAAAPFLNAVIEVRTGLSAERLLDVCLDVEAALGRERSAGWAPRTIDIDILTFGGMHLATDRLQVPHPRLVERDFVVHPLLDLAPELEVGSKTVRAMAAALPASGLQADSRRLWPASTVNSIAACAANRVIGRDGGLPWVIDEDWAVFLRKTRGGCLVMGRKSFEEMVKEPTWRDKRAYVVITSKPEQVEGHGVTVCGSVHEALGAARSTGRAVWICGGAGIYAETLTHTEALHLTRIDAAFEGDTFFPRWEDAFTERLAGVTGADAAHRYTFEVWSR